ncbi:MAG: FMN reductase, partial [Comamonadaceae bacterium]
PMDSRFAAGRWVAGATGAPQLLDALVALDCRVVRTVSEATHDVLLCEVVAVAACAPSAALIYQGRRFHSLPGAD